MASTSRIFFAGVGTTFVILALGFGGGLMLANTALKEPSSLQARANSNSMSPVRVILPTTAEAAQPPQQSPAFVMTAEPSHFQDPYRSRDRYEEHRRLHRKLTLVARTFGRPPS